ncbi:DgyrCDS3892 [Dimorphilus gyrociliatus]|uniref:DgyrCDS3892 n=1 Tax=Dimorphilus gyrociliatus TaxID=2664684 RepID=A0A7I8VFB0_9ANNE|nr:DgyrCDS3892 [Dimorphilus gyrociliatus]
MHPLFEQVLFKKDLSLAGEVFNVKNEEIEQDLSSIIQCLTNIVNREQYLYQHSEQSVVEIVLTRITSAIRETKSLDRNYESLIELLETCLKFNLQTTGNNDPPHSKIASDILSCIFMNNLNETIMKKAVPISIKFLDKKNNEIIRNLSSYLALAAIDYNGIIVESAPLIIKSILNGNKLLIRLLPQIYVKNSEPFDDYLADILNLISVLDPQQRSDLLSLASLSVQGTSRISELVETLCSNLNIISIAEIGPVLKTVAERDARYLVPYIRAIYQTVDTDDEAQILQVAELLTVVALSSGRDAAEVCTKCLVDALESCRSTQTLVLVRNLKEIAEKYPTVVHDHLDTVNSTCLHNAISHTALDQLKEICSRRRSACIQTDAVTVISVDDSSNCDCKPPLTASSSGISQAKNVATSTPNLEEEYEKASISVSKVQMTSPGTSTLVTVSKMHQPEPSYSTIQVRRDYVPPSLENAIPYRDAVQHFCEKHKDKIRQFIEHILARMPIPCKANVEEKLGGKRVVRLHISCSAKTDDCLYRDSFLTFSTRHPKLWIHIMLLAVQASSEHALAQHDDAVASLKKCWDVLDSGTSFVRVATSSFPNRRDQDWLVEELRDCRVLDMFEFDAARRHWGCFMCTVPNKFEKLLRDGDPAMEGNLKEKRGKWKVLKRWKTRYFTLSGGSIIFSSKRNSVYQYLILIYDIDLFLYN